MPTLNFKHLILLFPIVIFACAKEDNAARVRLVDLQGRPKPVTTHVPELNSNLMAAQDHNKMIGQNTPAINDTPTLTDKDIAAQYDVAPNNSFGNVVAAEAQKTLQNPVAPTVPAPPSPKIEEARQENGQVVEYDLSEGEKPVTKPEKVVKAKKVKAEKKAVVSSVGKGIYVQVGSFSSITNAKNTLEKMQKFHKGKVEEVEGAQTIYRVLLGPFANKQQARNLMNKIKNSGHDAIIVRNK